MSARKVVSWRNLPTRAPLSLTLVLWLVLERVGAPGWIWGVVGTGVACFWIAWAIDCWTWTSVDLWKEERRAP